MKTVKTKTILNLKWEEIDNNLFTTRIGDFSACVDGKNYRIDSLTDLDFFKSGHSVFKAKARSIADALQRATNKLAKLSTSDV